MDVDDVFNLENASNNGELEAHAVIEEGGDGDSNDPMAEDHVHGTGTATEEHVIVQQVGHGTKKKSMGTDSTRVVKQRTLGGKGKGAISISKSNLNKSTGTPTSKFMASSFKAAASNKEGAMVLLPKPAKAMPAANASASANVDVAASAQGNVGDEDDEEQDGKTGKKLTSWVWEHFTRFGKGNYNHNSIYECHGVGGRC